MIRKAAIAAILALASVSNAFTVTPSHRPALLSSPATRLGLMTADEEQSIMNTATDCAEGECSLDEVEALISELKEQQSTLSKRVEEMDGLIKSLKKLNTKDDREVDEVRETVRAIFRVFQLGDKASGNDYPSLSKPTGWSGEVGDGPTTAYDALPPKPMKKSP